MTKIERTFLRTQDENGYWHFTELIHSIETDHAILYHYYDEQGRRTGSFFTEKKYFDRIWRSAGLPA